MAARGNRGILLEVSIFYVFSHIADVASAGFGKCAGDCACRRRFCLYGRNHQSGRKTSDPKYLLTSISTVETGKWNKTAQQKMAWPWTINVRGKGHYYKTKEAAVAAAKALRKRGINNFDVGCMQINMRFHGKEFASLEDAFDPEKNVEYAARFLKRLYDRRQDWMKAATDYHSRRPAKAQAYKKRLLASLETVKKGHQTYLAMYAVKNQAAEEKLFAAHVEEPRTKRSWLSRLLWGDDEESKQDVKLSWRG